MNTITVMIAGTGTGVCSLTGKDSTDGLTVSFEDGTVQNQFLSWKAFRQLLAMKTGQAKHMIATGNGVGKTPQQS